MEYMYNFIHGMHFVNNNNNNKIFITLDSIYKFQKTKSKMKKLKIDDFRIQVNHNNHRGLSKYR